MFCFNCGTEIQLDRRATRQDSCPRCMSYVRCCRNCRFYDPGAHNQCREPQSSWVKDKESANFCDYFEPSSEKPVGNTRKADAMQKLNELFKKRD